MTRYRLVLAAILLAAFALVPPAAGTAGSIGFDVAVSAQQPEGSKAPESTAAKEESGEKHHDSGWVATIAKVFNFAILVWTLVYFLRTPLAKHLAGRIAKVREDLLTSAETRETASRQLAEIDAKLKALPLELEALKRRGAEDIVAERARIEQAAEAERQRLLEQTRREIDMRLRVAKRELIELTAGLAVGVARTRIERTITPDDQVRLVDRYAEQLRHDAAGGAARQGAGS